MEPPDGDLLEASSGVKLHCLCFEFSIKFLKVLCEPYLDFWTGMRDNCFVSFRERGNVLEPCYPA